MKECETLNFILFKVKYQQGSHNTSQLKYSFSFLGYPSSAEATAGRRPIVLKNFKISFSLIIEGNKVFSPRSLPRTRCGATKTIYL
ncbi:MAG: hypothetical protein A2744_00570 [Candidatus Buchananbacteria bacterium RIFCSPHIGHO2_01_FULL_44_11]|uniref:Uncharacterized protein n=1 Tax=Candidatus Buchananbacteria bacterium RIFCSPHIGHO2_01_FULL_44_11 TaxID=1797535 RepID=A0A1G1XYP0_9BACT|nr:MAG: hypothetical protein A2744_00570 [Candidatus Buchananbacteria bacterium RIFCSPHIGHO2_01_FULL_44_11]